LQAVTIMAEALWTIDELLAATGGKLHGTVTKPLTAVTIDSRAVGQGDIFVAIKGEKVGLFVRERIADSMLEQGAGKRSPLTEYPRQGRAGQGVIGIKLAGGDAVAGFAIVGPKDDVALTTSRGKTKLIKGRLFKSLGRATGGFGVQHVVKNEVITALIKPQMRIEASETVEAAHEPEQLELISEASPKKRGKAKKKTPA